MPKCTGLDRTSEQLQTLSVSGKIQSSSPPPNFSGLSHAAQFLTYSVSHQCFQTEQCSVETILWTRNKKYSHSCFSLKILAKGVDIRRIQRIGVGVKTAFYYGCQGTLVLLVLSLTGSLSRTAYFREFFLGTVWGESARSLRRSMSATWP